MRTGGWWDGKRAALPILWEVLCGLSSRESSTSSPGRCREERLPEVMRSGSEQTDCMQMCGDGEAMGGNEGVGRG